jgi:hypothetical protein
MTFKTYAMIGMCLLVSAAQAQVDTVDVNHPKLETSLLKEDKSSYLILLQDSSGNYLSPTMIWNRDISFFKGVDGQKNYRFKWQYFIKDTLYLTCEATGLVSNMAQLTHRVWLGKSPTPFKSYVYDGPQVTIPEADAGVVNDKKFKQMRMTPWAFSFPMDLEIFPLLPIKKVGQTWAMAYYEPGQPLSKYYKVHIVGQEKLRIAQDVEVPCWLLEIVYDSKYVATFWISQKGREVLKMKDGLPNFKRTKIRLF